MFKTVRQSKAPQQIIQQIRATLLEGKLKPGDRLASEKELMGEFAVSKSTLREALRALEYLGLIEIRKGVNGGTFAAEVSLEITKESLANFLHFKDLSVHHLSAIRKNLEPYAAQVAAGMISDDDLEELKSLNDLCVKALSEGDAQASRKNEIQFHRTIANATRNPILILILDFVENLLADVKRVLNPDIEFSKGVIESHQRIYQALADRDPEKASREMLKDVLKVEEGLEKLLEMKPTSSP